MSIDEFRASVSAFARPTLFEVSFPSLLDENIKFLCKGASLPPSTLGVIEVPFQGRKQKIPGDRTFQDWTITVMNDESMVLRKQLEDWSNFINGHRSNTGPASFKESLHNGVVKQFGNDGTTIAEYELIDCFPLEVGQIDLSFESVDTIEEFTVTLSYTVWDRTL